jgi:hypothetical protein
MSTRTRIFALLLLTLLFLCSGCGYITGAAIDSDVPVPAPRPVPVTGPLEPEPCGVLEATGVRVNVGDFISFHGCSTLPDGTGLQTQLYADKVPAAWWPADEIFLVHHGTWEVSVSLDGLDEDITGLYIGSEIIFSLKVWQKDNPSVKAQYMFELMGPPPALNPDVNHKPQ